MSTESSLEGQVPVTWQSRYRLDLPPGEPPAGGHPLLVALHGFGDDGDRLRDRLRGLDGAPYARLYPDAPFPVEMQEAPARRVGFAWYQFTGDQAAFMTALRFAADHLARVVADAAERHPLDLRRAVLLGYSQGGYLAGVAALSDPARWRGLVAIACRIKTESLGEVLPARRGYPVLIIHGARDQGMPLDRQRAAVDELRRHGVAVDFEVHDGGHGLRRESAPLIDAFVRGVLGPGGAPPRS